MQNEFIAAIERLIEAVDSHFHVKDEYLNSIQSAQDLDDWQNWKKEHNFQ